MAPRRPGDCLPDYEKHGATAIAKIAVRKCKRPTRLSRAFVFKGPGDDLLSHGQSAISSARRRFTVLFGMGRGGANALWSPGIRQCVLVFVDAHAQWGWKVVWLCIAS